jgi:hypothetical protein
MSSHNVELADLWVPTLIAFLLTALFVYIAARVVLDRSSIFAALLTALIGNVLGGLIYLWLGGWLGLILAVLVWSLVAALFFRTGWIKGALIGLVAWVLWLIIQLIGDAIAR